MYVISYFNHIKKSESCSEEDIRKLFKISNDKVTFIQYFDESVNSFIDCEWIEIPMLNCNSLRVCVESESCIEINNDKAKELSLKENEIVEINNSDNSTILTNSDENQDIFVIKDIRGEDHEDPFEKENAFIEINASNIEIAPQVDSDLINDTPTVSTSSANKDRSVTYGDLPTSYILPEINPNSNLGKALKEKRILSKGLKSQFLTKIHEGFSSKNIYNIGNQNRDVVNAILSTYPHLGMELSYESAKQLWTRILYAKFYNAKTRECANDEVIVKAKRLKQEFNEAKHKMPKMENNFGIPNYRPLPSADDEDQIMLESHRSWMISESKKNDQNQGAISKRMDLTFAERRRYLFEVKEDGTYFSASEMLKEYPCLGVESQAILELKRLFGVDFYGQLKNKMRDFALDVCEVVASSKSKYKGFVDKLINISSSQDQNEIAMKQLVGNVAVLLSENPSQIIGRELSQSGCPMLKMEENQSLALYVDNYPFIPSVSAGAAAFLWVGAFYVFNVKVPSQMKKTFEVLQHLFFKIPKNSDFPVQSMVRVIQLFNRNTQ